MYYKETRYILKQQKELLQKAPSSPIKIILLNNKLQVQSILIRVCHF